MSSLGRVKEFVNRNIMYFVMFPLIGGSQYAWWKMQDNPVFVHPEERKEFPLVTVGRHVLAFMGLGPVPEKKQR